MILQDCDSSVIKEEHSVRMEVIKRCLGGFSRVSMWHGANTKKNVKKGIWKTSFNKKMHMHINGLNVWADVFVLLMIYHRGSDVRVLKVLC